MVNNAVWDGNFKKNENYPWINDTFLTSTLHFISDKAGPGQRQPGVLVLNNLFYLISISAHKKHRTSIDLYYN